MLKFLEVCNSQFQRFLSSAHCNSYQKKKKKEKKKLATQWFENYKVPTGILILFLLFGFFFPWIMQHMYAMQTNKSNTTQDKEKLKSIV